MRYTLYRFGFATLFYAVLFLTTAEDVSSNPKSNDFDEYVYYQGVQGRPGVDFPVFARIPRTTFSCKQVPSGYYADLETDCQVFHICNEGSKISFLCPNGTIFQQSDLICEWWFKVNCTNSPNLYEESAEQLVEETWRRKQNRRPGYQNRLANEEKEKKKNYLTNTPKQLTNNNNNNNSKRKNNLSTNSKQAEITHKQTYPGSSNQVFLNQNQNTQQISLNRNNNGRKETIEKNKQPKLQSRGNQKYKHPINLKGRNELNLEDSSEESQVLAETASFYDNNNQNIIHSTDKVTTNQYTNQQNQKFNQGGFNQKTNRNLNFNQNNSNKFNVNSNLDKDFNSNQNQEISSNQNRFNSNQNQEINSNRNQFNSNQNQFNSNQSNNRNKSKQKINRNRNGNGNRNGFNQNVNKHVNGDFNQNYQNTNRFPKQETNGHFNQNVNQNNEYSSNRQGFNQKTNENFNRNNQGFKRNLNDGSSNQNFKDNSNRNSNHNYNQDSNKNYNQDSNRNYNQDSNRNYNQDSNRNYNQDSNRNSNYNSNEYNSNHNLNQDSSHKSNEDVNQKSSQPLNQNSNYNSNRNYNQDSNRNSNYNPSDNSNYNPNDNSNHNINRDSTFKSNQDINQQSSQPLNQNSNYNSNQDINEGSTFKSNEDINQQSSQPLNQNSNYNLNHNNNQGSNDNSNNFNQGSSHKSNQDINQKSNQAPNQNLNYNFNDNYNQDSNRNSNYNSNDNSNHNLNQDSSNKPNQEINQESSYKFNQNINQEPSQVPNQHSNHNYNQDSNRNSNYNPSDNSNHNLNQGSSYKSNQYINQESSQIPKENSNYNSNNNYNQDSNRNSNYKPNDNSNHNLNQGSSYKSNQDINQESTQAPSQNLNYNSNHNYNQDSNDNSNYTPTDNSNYTPNDNSNYTPNENSNYTPNDNSNYKLNQDSSHKTNQDVNQKSTQSPNQNSNYNSNHNYNPDSKHNSGYNSNDNSNHNLNQDSNHNLNQDSNQPSGRNLNYNLNQKDSNQNINQNRNPDSTDKSSQETTTNFNDNVQIFNRNKEEDYNKHQSNTENLNKYPNHQTTQDLNNIPTVTFVQSNQYTTEYNQKSNYESTNQYFTTERINQEINLSTEYDSSQFTTDQNRIFDQNQNFATTNKNFETTNQNVATTNQNVPTTNQNFDTTNQNVATTNQYVATTNQNYQFTTNKPFETTTNLNFYENTNQDFDQKREQSVQNSKNTESSNFYPNHKETYTEVHEPKFISTKAYTTGTQTIPPQTVVTNRIPLNDGKPFVISTPKSSYNIKEFTTENFFYSPTVPPFTTTTTVKSRFGENTEISTNTQSTQQEEVTFSAPYSNVVTENVNLNQKDKKKGLESRFLNDENKVQVVNSISIDDSIKSDKEEVISENLNNKTEYVRISSSIIKKDNPEKIKLSVSNSQKEENPPIVYRRYSAAISQADPNNACVDEIVNRKGTTRKPKVTKKPEVTIKSDVNTQHNNTKKTDFDIVIGRKRTEDSKVYKISKYPDVQKPRSFEKATESSIYRVDIKNKAVEKVTEKGYNLKPTGFYVTKSFNEDELNPSTKFGVGNTYLPKATTPNGLETDRSKEGTPIESITNNEDFDVIQKPKPFELPPKISKTNTLPTTEGIYPTYEVSSARPFTIESTQTINPTEPTIFTPSSRSPKIYENVSNMLNTLKDLIKTQNETETREGLIVPPSAGPQTLHSLAVYFANALEGVETEEETTTENDSKDIELLSIPTLNRYKDLFKEDEEVITTTEESNDLEGQHTKSGVVTPRVRQLAQVFTKALSSYLDDPEMFRKYLQDVRPTEPSIHLGTTQRSVDNTEEDELLNYSDADIKPELPKLSTTTPSIISSTWGYILAPNNSNTFEYNSLSTDGENLQSADSQSFVSQFNNYIKEKHFSKTTPLNTTPLNTNLKDIPKENSRDLFKDKLYKNPLAINDDLEGKIESSEPTEINYELRTLPRIELNSTQVHGILIDFMNTTKNQNSRLNRILSKLNTTQDEFLNKMREIEQNPLTRRLILLLISECAGNITDSHHNNHYNNNNDNNNKDVIHEASNKQENHSNLDLFDSSRLAENDKHVSKNSAIPKFVDQTLKDEDEDTRALELLNSLYTIASRYGK